MSDENKQDQPQDSSANSVGLSELLAEQNKELREALKGLLCWCPHAEAVAFPQRRLYVEAKVIARAAVQKEIIPS